MTNIRDLIKTYRNTYPVYEKKRKQEKEKEKEIKKR